MKSKNMLLKVLSVVVVLGVLTTACGAPAATEAPAQTEAPEVTEAPAMTEEPAATDAPATEATGKEFEGVTVNLLTFVGPQVAEPLQRRGAVATDEREIGMRGRGVVPRD